MEKASTSLRSFCANSLSLLQWSSPTNPMRRNICTEFILYMNLCFCLCMYVWVYVYILSKLLIWEEMRCGKRAKPYISFIGMRSYTICMNVFMYVCVNIFFLHGSINIYFVNWYIFMSMSRYRCLPRQPSPAMSLWGRSGPRPPPVALSRWTATPTSTGWSETASTSDGRTGPTPWQG